MFHRTTFACYTNNQKFFSEKVFRTQQRRRVSEHQEYSQTIRISAEQIYCYVMHILCHGLTLIGQQLSIEFYLLFNHVAANSLETILLFE